MIMRWRARPRRLLTHLTIGAAAVLGLAFVPAVHAQAAPAAVGHQRAADAWNPPARLVGPLDQVWQRVAQGNWQTFRNFGWDQLMANRGYINYCVSWNSSGTVTAAQRDAVHAAVARSNQRWFDTMIGHNGFPYTQVPIRVVGWATRDRNQLQWTDTSVDVTVNNIRDDAPQCHNGCARFLHQDGNYSGCPGGAARHYDQTLYISGNLGGGIGGAGGDWGQVVSGQWFMGNLDNPNPHILIHELGHTYGLMDFYDWDPLPNEGYVMKAGSGSQS